MATLSGGGVNYNADNVDYDNTTSGLSANNVQDAIDEVNGTIKQLKYDTTEVPLTRIEPMKFTTAIAPYSREYIGCQFRATQANAVIVSQPITKTTTITNIINIYDVAVDVAGTIRWYYMG